MERKRPRVEKLYESGMSRPHRRVLAWSIVIVALVLTLFWYERVVTLRSDVEEMSLNSTTKMLSLAVVLRATGAITEDGPSGVVGLVGANPVEWADENLSLEFKKHYVGEMNAVDILSIARGKWAYDRQRKHLVYRKLNGDFKRWQVLPKYYDQNKNGRYDAPVEPVNGLELVEVLKKG